MICDICSKHKATVHLTEIVNEQVSKLNLCEYCAKKKGAQMEQQFGIADLLQGLAEFGEKSTTPTVQKVKCLECGMSFDEFKKIGRLGCAECYTTFTDHLDPLLKRIHSSNQHTGKSPQKSAVVSKRAPAAKAKAKPPAEKIRSEIQMLKTQLKKAVSNEAYEEAAVIRDKIKTLEGQQKKSS